MQACVRQQLLELLRGELFCCFLSFGNSRAGRGPAPRFQAPTILNGSVVLANSLTEASKCLCFFNCRVGLRLLARCMMKTCCCCCCCSGCGGSHITWGWHSRIFLNTASPRGKQAPKGQSHLGPAGASAESATHSRLPSFQLHSVCRVFDRRLNYTLSFPHDQTPRPFL